MARIRTVKPDFFRHELLQDLEITHAGKCPMLVFEGLWGHCDKLGRFLWRPKHLKLDILPFLPFDMAGTLLILEQANLVVRYTAGGLEYGWIPTFTEHQAIGGKEAQGAAKNPDPPSEVLEKYREATGKHPRLQEGKGREGNKEGNRGESSPPVDKSNKSKPNGAWWKSEAGIKEKGEQLNMTPERGESWTSYKDRIFKRLEKSRAVA